jgi:hypothetical protein
MVLDWTVKLMPDPVVACWVAAFAATDGRAVAARVMVTIATAALTATATDPGYPVVAVATSLLPRRRLVVVLKLQCVLQAVFGPLLTATGLPNSSANVAELVPASTTTWC